MFQIIEFNFSIRKHSEIGIQLDLIDCKCVGLLFLFVCLFVCLFVFFLGGEWDDSVHVTYKLPVSSASSACSPGFYYLKGALAVLEVALIQYAMQKAMSKVW